MRYELLGLTLSLVAAHRVTDRESLLAADRALASRSFVPSFTDSAAYLQPGAPLLRGSRTILSFLETAAPARTLTRVPVYADVSADGTLGYTFGWVRSDGTRGKYLACWRNVRGTWQAAAYAWTTPTPIPDSIAVRPTSLRSNEPAPAYRGPANPNELLQADAAFAAMSVSQGAKSSFVAFAADEAVSFGPGAEMSEGREAIAGGFAGLPQGAVLEWWPVAADIASSGDLGCTVGEATIASLKHHSKYLTIWKRQQDGSWKFVADGGNARPAPAASGTPPPED